MQRFIGTILILFGVLGFIVAIIALIVGLGRPGNPGWPIATVLIGGGVGLLLILIGLWVRAGAKFSGAKTPVAGSRIGNFLADVPEARFLGESVFEVQYQTPVSGKNGRPAMLTLRIPVATPTTIQLTPETWSDRFGKRIGIAREVQTGDPGFDDAIYIRCPSEEYAAQYAGSPEKRAGIVALVHAGFREVKLTGSAIEAIWMNFDPAKNDRPGLTEDAAAALSILADDLPIVDPDFAVPTDWSFIWCVVLWIATILFAATGIALFVYPPLRGWDLFVSGLEVFAFEYAVLAMAAATLLRGTSVSHDRWWTIVIVGFFLIGLGSLGSMAGYNALADEAPFERRVEAIVSKHSSSGKGGTTYYVAVRDWAHPGDLINFRVSSGEYNLAAPGRSKMHLAIGPGKCAIPWLKSQSFQQ